MIEVSLMISLIVFFINACTWKGHIFEKVRDLIPPEKKLSKPLYNCPICMTPYYGTLMYAIFWEGFDISGFDSVFNMISTWLVVIGAAAGFSVINVILVYVKDYCKKRTPPDDECCVGGSEVPLTGSAESENVLGEVAKDFDEPKSSKGVPLMQNPPPRPIKITKHY